MRARDALSTRILLLATVAALGASLPASAQRYLVKEINPAGWQGGVASVTTATLGSRIIFGADDGVHGREPWVSDGTAEGTALVKDLWPPEVDDPTEAYSSAPDHFLTVGNSVYFRARVPPPPADPPEETYDCGSSLWITDGTESGTERLPICPTDAEWAVIGSTLYLFAESEAFGDALVKVSGTEITLVTAFEPGRIFGVDLTVVDFDLYGPRLVFAIADSDHGWELWTSDGTGAGTAMLKDIRPGTASSNPRYITNFDGRAWFAASDGDGDNELWVSDGTADGTVRFADLNAGGSGAPQELVTAGDHLYFCATDGSHGLELWATGGFPGDPLMLTDTDLDYECFGTPMADFGGSLVFPHRDAAHGVETWISDGTADGTVLLCDADPGADSSAPSWYHPAGDRLFFGGRKDGLSYLWVTGSDGTDTLPVLPDGFAKAYVGSRLFFVGFYPYFYSDELFALPLPDFVTVPEPPTGSIEVNTGVPYTYSTAGGSVSTEGDRVQYRFLWGDQGDSGWLPFGVTSAEVTWDTEDVHVVTVEARAEHSGMISAQSYPRSVVATFEEVILETTLEGPGYGEAGVASTYTLTSGSNSDHALEYWIDWNDGTEPSWLPFDTETGSIELSHTWQNLGSYEVVARVRCATHTWVEGSTNLWVEITEEFIHSVTLSGPASGYVGHEYAYTISGESSFGHDLEYAVSWGDGEGHDIDWTPFPEGQNTVTVSYAWSFAAPDFPVWAGVRCATHHDVENGDDMTVEMVDAPAGLIFADDFENRDCEAWSSTVGEAL